MDTNSIISFAHGKLDNWVGLPENFSVAELIEVVGTPNQITESELGYYPAVKYQFAVDETPDGLIAFVRQEIVILIETKKLPPPDILKLLPEPDASLPHEILVAKAYAAELIFSSIGLNLTIANHFDKTMPDSIVRCRGFKRMKTPADFDAGYYKSFDDTILWQNK